MNLTWQSLLKAILGVDVEPIEKEAIDVYELRDNDAAKHFSFNYVIKWHNKPIVWLDMIDGENGLLHAFSQTTGNHNESWMELLELCKSEIRKLQK
jgi:hypothetical protein